MQWSIIGVTAAAGIAALLGAWWLWWRLPKRQVDRLRLTIRDPKARADVEDNFRKTIGQLLGGAAVLIGAALAYLQFSQQQQTSQRQFSQQQQASHELLISNQVSKGFEQLGSAQVVVRLGGIYALEGVMNTSVQYHQPVLEALTAFVLDVTRTETGDGPPATDIQAALTVIGRRASIGTGFLPNLANAHIPKAKLSGANLNSANLNSANLNGADLSGAHLSGADLRGADLSHAYLTNAADLSHAYLGSANLSGAVVGDANLSGADLSVADLSGAILLNADLSGAVLRGAVLRGAVLRGAVLRDLVEPGGDAANLSGVDLSLADLRGAIVFQQQLDEACGTNVKLDPDLTLKPCSK